MKRFFLTITILLWATSAHATIWYVDSAIASSGNGQSWATAWKNVTNATGLAAGDTIYISGGSSSQSYSVSNWTPTSGASGNPITWAVGQDAGHNGTVIFTGGTNWLTGAIHDVTIDGNHNGVKSITVQSYSGYVWAPGSAAVARIKLKYINFPNMIGGFYFNQSTTTNLEWDHCMVQKIDSYPADKTNSWFAMNGSGWDSHLIHDCEIYYPVKGTDQGYGDDVVQWGSGLSFYNNFVKGVFGTYANYQHADVFQIDANYFKIYNNYFEDVGESIVYQDAYSSRHTVTGFLFYNNVLAWSHSSASSGYPRGIDIQSEASGAGSSYVDFAIVNNTFIDWNASNMIFLVRIDPANTGGCTNCSVKNNIFYNGSGLNLYSSVVAANNTTGSVQFEAYTHYGGSSNNLHLKSTDSIARDHGTSLTNIGTANFALDKDSVSRPQGSAWDIGAYEFGTGNSGGTIRPMPPTLH